MKMKKIALLLAMILLLSSMTVFANSGPVIYKDTITVDKDGGSFKVGFITVEFKKDFLDESQLPATFDVEIYAEDGKGYIEFSPDTENFNKPVHLFIDSYDGQLFDKALGQNIDVDVKKSHIKVDHFSRYCFWR